jgi:hypothetical protein
VGFFGLLRASEFCSKAGCPGLTLQQLSWNSDFSKLILHLDQSKSDILRDGVDITLFSIPSSQVRPLLLLRTYITAFRSSASASDPVFLVNNRAMTYTFFQSRLRQAIGSIGLLPSLYSSHSLRIGAATSLAILGFPSHFIQTLGRWKSLAFQLYVRLGESEIRSAMASVGSSKLFSNKMAYPHDRIGSPSLETINSIRVAFSSS